MGVAAPFRRTLEDIASEAGDVIIIVIGIIILYALITIGSKLWGGLSGLFAGIQGLSLGGGGQAGGIGGGGIQGGGGGIVPYTGPGQAVQPNQWYAGIVPGGNVALITKVSGPITVIPSYKPPVVARYPPPAIQFAPGVQYIQTPSYPTPAYPSGGYYALPSQGPTFPSFGVPLVGQTGIAGIISAPTKITIPGGAGGKI